MRILRFLTLGVISGLACTVQAQISSNTVLNSLSQPKIVLNWSGGQKEFDLAVDQVGVITKSGEGRIIYYSPGATVSHAVFQVGDLRRKTGDRTALVLYNSGEPQSARSRVLLTSHVLVKLDKGTRASSVARSVNATVVEASLPYAPDYAVLEVEQPGASLATAQYLRNQQGVAAADPLVAEQPDKYLIPNDTFFPNQWHLRNVGQGGGVANIDANVVTVWDTFRGSGIGIGILDDGFQFIHPDLSPNANLAADEDFNSTPRDGDPSPNLAANDSHGTAVGGVAGARGSNSIGVSGAAPLATLYGMRLIASPITEQVLADAFNHRNDIIHIKNNSWGYATFYWEFATTLPEDALRTSTINGRGGRGTINVFAAGNSGGAGASNANHRHPQHSRYVLTVGAIANNGIQSSYSEPGSNLVVSAPSNGGSLGITTVDLLGIFGYNFNGTGGEPANIDYTNSFGGTSSAAPLVSGCIALLLDSRPTLGWRDVYEILMRSATRIHTSDPDWIVNGDGFHFNHRYGAGMVNAQAAVTLANGWTNLGPQISTSVANNTNVAIPDNNPTGTTKTFNVTQNFRVEHVIVTVSATHARRGDLEFDLISPTGTVSRLMTSSLNDPGGAINTFPFNSVRNWGERSNGTWRVIARDRFAGSTGQLGAVSLQVWGSDTGGGGGGGGGGGPVVRGTQASVWIANDLPAPIPDNNPTGVTSTVLVGPGAPISRLEITTRAQHPVSSQLTVTLTAPNGATTTVSNEAGARNFVTTSQSISAFNGVNRTGTWRLRVVDSAGRDTGVLHGFSLKIW
jgi:subtilisin-like proprotein convertase family protein